MIIIALSMRTCKLREIVTSVEEEEYEFLNG